MTRGPDKQFDRDQVLDRAIQLFWAQGFEATGMSQLTEHMGIGRQSLYDTFGDKRSLFMEALDRYVQERAALAVRQLRAPGSPIGNLRKVLGAMQEASRANPGCGCLMGNAVAELGARDPRAARTLDGYVRRLEDAFTETFDRAREAGEIRTQVDSRSLARTLITTFQGMALLTKVRKDPDFARGVLEAQLAMITGG